MFTVISVQCVEYKTGFKKFTHIVKYLRYYIPTNSPLIVRNTSHVMCFASFHFIFEFFFKKVQHGWQPKQPWCLASALTVNINSARKKPGNYISCRIFQRTTEREMKERYGRPIRANICPTTTVVV